MATDRFISIVRLGAPFLPCFCGAAGMMSVADSDLTKRLSNPVASITLLFLK